MRLKSVHIRATNQRIKRTCAAAANIFMLCLLSNQVWCSANIKHQRLVGHVSAKRAANYEDVAASNSYHQPHFTGNRSVVVQLFEWKFVDIAAECRDFLGPQGYAGVQLSPVLEHTIVKTAELNHPWWERYEVVSYRLASRSGDESEFWSMSRICNEHGVRIYADVVLNHMAAPLNYVAANVPAKEAFIVNTLLETSVNISQQNYSQVPYTRLDFHQPSCLVWDNVLVHDAHETRNCQLNGHPDLNHSRQNVQKHVVEMLNKLVGMGVAGFRIDTAKHIWPIDLKNILKEVNNLSTEFNFKKNSRPFIYHDVFDLGFDTVSKTEYSTYGVVSEYLYPVELSTVLRGKVALSSLINWGPALGFLPHEDALVFIDSHDTQRGRPPNLGNNQVLTYKQRIKYIMASAFMLVHPYGAIKRIMSSYYFPPTNINQGPPAEGADGDEIRSPTYNKQKQCTRESGWVCEHRWPELVGMVKVANFFKRPDNKEESVIYFQTNGANQVAFCRGYKAFVAINNDPAVDFVKEVYACLEPGTYCDVITGGKKEGKEECHGKMLEINGQGYIKLELGVAEDNQENDEENIQVESREEESGRIASYGIFVIYAESKIEPPNGGNTQQPVRAGEGQSPASEDNDDIESNEDNQGKEEKSEENTGDLEEEDSKTGDEQKEVEGEGDPENAAEQNTEDLNTEAVTEGLGEQEGEPQTDTENEPPEENEPEQREVEGEDDSENPAGDENKSEQNTEALNSEAETEGSGGQEGDPQEDTKIEENDAEQKEAEGEDDSENSADDKNTDTPDYEEETDALGEHNPASTESPSEDTNGEEKEEKELENEESSDNDDGEVKEQTDIEQSEEKKEEEEAVEAETDSGEAAAEYTDKNSGKEEDKEDENSEAAKEETLSSTEELTEADNLSKEPDSHENGDKEKDEQNIEKDDEENSNTEETHEESEPTPEAAEGKEKPDDLPIDEEIKAEEEEPGSNKSRNLDDGKMPAEAQIEKPSAEVVDAIDEAADGVTAKIQDIQAAGIISNSKESKNTG